MSDLQANGVKEKSSGPRTLLLVSLALNLFLAGAIAASLLTGAAWRHFRPGEPPAFHGPLGGLIASARSEEDKESFREMRRIMRENFRDARPMIKELREARKEAARQIKAEPYDADAVEAAMMKIHEVMGRLSLTTQKGIAAALADASPQVREKFAEHLMRPHRGRRHHGTKPARAGNGEEPEEPGPDMIP
jgi:uncharacterized membrane protein